MKAHSHGFISPDNLQWFQIRPPPRESKHFPSGGHWELYLIDENDDEPEMLMGDIMVFEDVCLIYSDMSDELYIRMQDLITSKRFLENLTINSIKDRN